MPKEHLFSDVEIKVLLSLVAFSAIWVLAIVPFLADTSNPVGMWINGQNPVVRYLFKEIGWIAVFVGIVGSIFSYVFDRSFDMRRAFENGLAAWASFNFVIGLWDLPLGVSPKGELTLISPSFITTSADEFFYFIFNSLFPGLKETVIPFIDVSLIFPVIYILVPISWLVIAAAIFSKGKLYKATLVNQGIKVKR